MDQQVLDKCAEVCRTSKEGLFYKNVNLQRKDIEVSGMYWLDVQTGKEKYVNK